MPKFLDQPSWYVDVSGTPRQVWGAPMVQEFADSSVALGDILSKQVQGGFSLRNLRVNGSAMNDINIYAPTTSNASGQILVSQNGGTPLFKSLYLHCITYTKTGTNISAAFWDYDIMVKTIVVTNSSAPINTYEDLYTLLEEPEHENGLPVVSYFVPSGTSDICNIPSSVDSDLPTEETTKMYPLYLQSDSAETYIYLKGYVTVVGTSKPAKDTFSLPLAKPSDITATAAKIGCFASVDDYIIQITG